MTLQGTNTRPTMTFKKLLFLSFLTTFITFTVSTHALAASDKKAEDAVAPTSADATKGEALFKANCASCHKLDSKLVGPALTGVEGRWDNAGDYKGKSGAEWLHQWIKNNPSVTDAGYPYAVKLKADYNNSAMTPFPNLKTEDVDNILAYIANPPAPKVGVVPPGGPTGGGNGGENPFTTYFLYILIVILALIAAILYRVSSTLERVVAEKDGIQLPDPIPFYKNRKLWGAAVLVLLIFVANATVNGAINLGRQQGYMPVQPIKFSHKLHAGINKINCNYCHQGAAKGKQSTIPAVNVCMNCHKGITQAVVNGVHGRKEITKIYASIGFNPNTGQYIKDYDKMPREQAEGIFREWLKGDTSGVSEADVNAVLAQIQQPIEWVRIHNLPDHVYFNHSQHVTVGGLACQTCHGPVETMDVMYQFSPLSMGWCLSCHRNQTVNFTGNDYYKVFSKYQQDVKEGKLTKVTVEKVGGTECQKCHY